MTQLHIVVQLNKKLLLLQKHSGQSNHCKFSKQSPRNMLFTMHEYQCSFEIIGLEVMHLLLNTFIDRPLNKKGKVLKSPD